MDNTQLNIKMYEKAEEIQRLWKPQVGDWFYKRDGIGFGLWLVCAISAANGEILWCSGERMNQPPFDGQLVQFTAPENYIWLPSLVQLQKMVSDQYTITEHHESLWNVATTVDYKLGRRSKEWFGSPEMAWRAFVMKEIYTKLWDGQDWVQPKEHKSDTIPELA